MSLCEGGEFVDDTDLEELADLIKRGYTSGRLDPGDGSCRHISWELHVTAWKDD